MVWFVLLQAASVAYLACYTAHCIKRRYILAAVGAGLLAALPALLLVAFVSIMLQSS